MTAFEKKLVEKYHLPDEVLETLQSEITVSTEQGWFKLGPVDKFSLMAVSSMHQTQRAFYD